jgi:hypothetical protein
MIICNLFYSNIGIIFVYQRGLLHQNQLASNQWHFRNNVNIFTNDEWAVINESMCRKMITAN